MASILGDRSKLAEAPDLPRTGGLRLRQRVRVSGVARSGGVFGWKNYPDISGTLVASDEVS